MADALSIVGLTKRYGSVRALRGIDLAVAQGEIFGFLGPNGAGKSTTIRVLLDLIRPTSGRAVVFGFDCQRESVQARRRIAYLPSDPVYRSGATGLEVFEFTAAMRGVSLDRSEVADLCDRLDLDPTRKVTELSRGNRQKVGIVQALLPHAPLLVLDEPTTGLDPLNQHAVEVLLREAAERGTTVFFSSHILSEVESLCTRAAIVRAGQVVEVVDLTAATATTIHVEVEFVADVHPAALPPGTAFVAQVARRMLLTTTDDSINDLVQWLAGEPIRHLEIRESTLEERFLQFYRDEPDGAA